MSTTEQIQIFADARIRTAWDDKAEKWYFSIVDVVAVLTDSQDYQQARNYWKVLKNRLRQEGNETGTKCNQLKFVASDDRRSSVKQCRYAVSSHHSRSRRRGFPGHFPTGLAWPGKTASGNAMPAAVPFRYGSVREIVLQFHKKVKKKKNFF